MNGVGNAGHTALLDDSPRLLLIDGEPTEPAGAETFSSTNPATGELVANLSKGRAEDVDHAVSAARRAFEGPWRSVGPADRQRIIMRLAELVDEHADELARLDSLEMGGPLTRVRGGVNSSVAFLEWYASLARNIRGETIENSRPSDFLSYTLREPVGVVGAITPWNSPLPMATWKLGPVLATGCTLVLKPAEQASLSALRLSELCLAAGVPPGVVNVVTGLGDAGAALAAHPDVDKVAFTGSVETGQEIVRASAGNVKRLTLELGGKSPIIVFADADLEEAAHAASRSIFGNSGQVCVAASRLFVERAIHDEFIARIVEISSGLVIGDPLDPATDLGPVASETQLKRVLSYVDGGIMEGARLAAGGERMTEGDLGKGYYFKPTVFADVGDEMRIAREEIFGPVLATMAFDGFEELPGRANGTRYGLAAYVWTRDVGKAHRLAASIRAGTVSINSIGNLDPAVPVGGFKMSGYGRELGTDQLNEYLEVKSVWIKTG